jgi:short-subunit dehydrogenase
MGKSYPVINDETQRQIVFVSSTMGDAAFPMMVSYGSTKEAVTYFARGLRREVEKHGSEVMLFVSGHTKTSISNHLQDSIPEWYGKSASSLTAEEVADNIIKKSLFIVNV